MKEHHSILFITFTKLRRMAESMYVWAEASAHIGDKGKASVLSIYRQEENVLVDLERTQHKSVSC